MKSLQMASLVPTLCIVLLGINLEKRACAHYNKKGHNCQIFFQI